ncbi:MAG: hypothetical protein HQK95_05855 [Nitrospirae bacterium]|nr:hypothetical protein [Nitrospirota bacterium]
MMPDDTIAYGWCFEYTIGGICKMTFPSIKRVRGYFKEGLMVMLTYFCNNGSKWPVVETDAYEATKQSRVMDNFNMEFY